MTGEQMVRANGVELCAETFGDRADPAILLIMGAGASMLYWDAAFCRRLAESGRFVIRYDHRDMGRSTSYEAGAPTYTFPDLVADAVGILDAFELSRAHVVGMSMGGWIGQLMALDHPGRVATLTLQSTTPGAPDEAAEDLPGMTDELLAAFAEESAEPDWSDREAVIGYHLASERPFAGSHGFDENAWRDLAAHSFDRTVDVAASMRNHFVAEDGEPWRKRLPTLDVPTLVLHGEDDPMFPLGNGRALAAEIPGAELVVMEATGHEPPPPHVWDAVIPAIIRHTGPG